MEAQKRELEDADAKLPREHKVRTRLTIKQIHEAELAFALLGNQSLLTAVDFFRGNYREPTTNKTLIEAKDEFLKMLRDVRKRSPAYLDTISKDLDKLCSGLRGNMRPHEFRYQPHADEFMSKLKFVPRGVIGVNGEKPEPKPVGDKRWNNIRGSCHAFFEWMRTDRVWCSANPFAPIKEREIPRYRPQILSVRQAAALMEDVMTYQQGMMVPYFALLLFAGIRPAQKRGEIEKLGTHPRLKRLINHALQIIDITPEIAKGRFVRQVTIQPALKAWLMEFPVIPYPVLKKLKKGERHPEIEHSHFDNPPRPLEFPILPPRSHSMISEIRKGHALGHDVLRHSFISYHAAKFKSTAATASEAGNSEEIIIDHYLKRTTTVEADLFWSITPELLRTPELYDDFKKKADEIEYLKIHGKMPSSNDAALRLDEMNEEQIALLQAEAQEVKNQRLERGEAS